MYCTYVLYSKKFNKTYTGFTGDLISRFHAHNKLATKGYTLKFRPWIVVHVTFFKMKKEALAHEKYLKSGKGRAFIKKEILPLYR